MPNLFCASVELSLNWRSRGKSTKNRYKILFSFCLSYSFVIQLFVLFVCTIVCCICLYLDVNMAEVLLTTCLHNILLSTLNGCPGMWSVHVYLLFKYFKIAFFLFSLLLLYLLLYLLFATHMYTCINRGENRWHESVCTHETKGRWNWRGKTYNTNSATC